MRDTLEGPPAVQIVFRQEDSGARTVNVGTTAEHKHAENYILQVGFLNVKGDDPLCHHIGIRDLKQFLMSTELIVSKNPRIEGTQRPFLRDV